jgi:hypothetical protein
MPWALIGAILIVLLAEGVLRYSHWPKILPYEMGRMEYFVASEQIDRAGAAEVSIVGSSRTRESLVVPELAKRLSDAAGRKVTVASYACSGAYTSDFEAVTKRLLRAKQRPKVILIGVGERDLSAGGGLWDQVALFQNLHDLHEDYGERGIEVLNDLPVVIRHNVGTYWRTLGLREFLHYQIVARVLGNNEPRVKSPAEGGLSIWQQSSPSRNLVKKAVKKSRVLERAEATREDEMPAPQLANALNDLAYECHRRGVQLIFYEVHRSNALRKAFPRAIYAHFLRIVDDVAERNCARFVKLGDLGLKLTDSDMREPSHMSFRGAHKLTQALADRIVKPILVPQQPAKKKHKPAKRRSTTAPIAHDDQRFGSRLAESRSLPPTPSGRG